MFEFINGIGEKAIEETVISLLSSFSTMDMDFAAANGISLLEQTMQYRPGLLRTARATARQFCGQKQHLTTDNVISWLWARRPDLYTSLMVSARNRKWLDTQIEQFRLYLWE